MIGVAQSPRANILFSDVLSSTNTCKWSLVKILPDRFSLENGDAAVNSFGERPTIEYDQAFTRVSGYCRDRRWSALDTIARAYLPSSFYEYLVVADAGRRDICQRIPCEDKVISHVDAVAALPISTREMRSLSFLLRRRAIECESLIPQKIGSNPFVL